MLHGCGTESQVEVEQQISPSHTGRFHKEEEEISGQMGDIIPPGCRPTDSTVPVSHGQHVWYTTDRHPYQVASQLLN